MTNINSWHTQASVRLVKTPEVDRVISFLRERFSPLSEAEIIKLALSEMYKKEQRMSNEDEVFRARFNRVIAGRWGGGETPQSLAALQKEAKKNGATSFTPEEIEKEIAAARAAPKKHL